MSVSARQTKSCAFFLPIRAARSRRYRAHAMDCKSLSTSSAQCTGRTRGHGLCRSVDKACLERVRAYQSTEGYKKALRKRQVWVDPLCAEGKTGMRRFLLRLHGLGQL